MSTISAMLSALTDTQKQELFSNLTPISDSQRRLWFVYQLNPDSPAYNVPYAYRLTGALDHAALTGALSELISRHEILRTAFVEFREQVYQLVLDAEPVEFEPQQLRLPSGGQNEEHLRELVREYAQRPFLLAENSAFRAQLFKIDTQDHLLLLTFHHIVVDGWSLSILGRELSALYGSFRRGRGSTLQEAPLQYGDFARWQREFLGDGRAERQLEFWRRTLSGCETQISLPTDYSRMGSQSYRGGTYTTKVDPNIVKGINELAHRCHATTFMVLLAALQAVLYRYTGEVDIVLGTSTFNRKRPEFESLAGFFVNTLALRGHVNPSASFFDLVVKARGTALDAFENEDVPYDRVVETARPVRSAEGFSLFHLVIEFQSGVAQSLSLEGLHTRPFELRMNTSKFDITFFFMQGPDGLELLAEYNHDLFERANIERFCSSLLTFLVNAVKLPESSLDSIPMLDEKSEREQRLATSGPTAPIDPRSAPEVFHETARKYPERVALTDGHRQLTFHDLDRFSSVVARHLREKGLRLNEIVGLVADRGINSIIALLGIWKAGGAYLPLDPRHPPARCDFICRDAGVRLVLGDLAAILAEPTAGTDSITAGENAYVIYTSGSTGEPKATVISHRALSNLKAGLDNAIFHAGDLNHGVASLNAPLVFDASVQQLCFLLGGRTLHLLSEAERQDGEALLHALGTGEITIFDCTPTHLQILIAAGLFERKPPKLRKVLVGGEPIPKALWEQLRTQPEIEFYNVYGPTECTVDATCHRINADDDRPVIGKPLQNVRCYIVDSELRLVPHGATGEIVIAGPGISAGYLNRPELSASRFIPDRWGNEGERAYLTGDRGRFLKGDVLKIFGRQDDQVKVRGFRVELGEIEAALKTLPGVNDAVVVARDGGPRGKTLHGFVVRTQHDGAAARTALLAQLPEYMVPETIVALPKFPLNASGKVDRRALAQLGPVSQASHARADLSEAEQRMLDLWKTVLDLQEIGPDQNFFDLGGHSLLAAQLMQKVRRSFSSTLTVAALFEAPTIRGLTAKCSGQKERRAGYLGGPPGPARSHDPLTDRRKLHLINLAQGSASHLPLYLFHPLGGDVLPYRSLLDELSPRLPVFGVQSKALNDPSHEYASADEMIDAYAAEIIRVGQRSACHLLGWSLGGLLALGAAERLERAGVPVESVEVWDCGIPAQRRERPPAADPIFGYFSVLNVLGDSFLDELDEGARILLREQLFEQQPADRAAWLLNWARREAAFTAKADPFVFERNARLASHHYWLFTGYVPPMIKAPLRVRWARLSLERQRITRTDWRQYSSGTVNEQVVEGTHYTMLKPPLVAALGSDLNHYYERHQKR